MLGNAGVTLVRGAAAAAGWVSMVARGKLSSFCHAFLPELLPKVSTKSHGGSSGHCLKQSGQFFNWAVFSVVLICGKLTLKPSITVYPLSLDKITHSFKNHSLGWERLVVVDSTCCSFRGPGVSKDPHQVAHNYLHLQFQWIWCLWHPWAPALKVNTHTHRDIFWKQQQQQQKTPQKSKAIAYAGTHTYMQINKS